MITKIAETEGVGPFTNREFNEISSIAQRLYKTVEGKHQDWKTILDLIVALNMQRTGKEFLQYVLLTEWVRIRNAQDNGRISQEPESSLIKALFELKTRISKSEKCVCLHHLHASILDALLNQFVREYPEAMRHKIEKMKVNSTFLQRFEGCKFEEPDEECMEEIEGDADPDDEDAKEIDEGTYHIECSDDFEL